MKIKNGKTIEFSELMLLDVFVMGGEVFMHVLTEGDHNAVSLTSGKTIYISDQCEVELCSRATLHLNGE